MWVVILLGALLWPGHGLGILDGIPLDRPLEAIVVGALVPALWWLNPRFMRRGLVRVGIALLILLKVADATLLTQQGWCVRFETPPLYEAGPSVQTSWDARADWRSPSPRCSAIVSRPYWSFTRFPVWFLNLQDTRPPRVPVHATFDGYVRTAERSTLSIDTYGSSDLRPTSVALPDGVSHVRFAGTFVGSEWKFAPLLNGNDVFSAALTTISPPTAIDLVLGRLLPAAITVLAIALIVAWVADAMTSLAPSQPVVWWTIITAVLCAAAGALDFDRLGRLTVLLFVVAVIVPTPQHLRNRRGAFLLFGVPWLALLIAGCIGHAGRITIYSVGDDWTTFQRFAHRIYIQGYWLEGGERGFWQQPLYRWIVGALHVVFGDASIGEMFLDAAALFAGSLFAFEVVRRVAGFSTGVGAGVLTLVTVAFGPNWHVIGRGLSDAVAAGLI
ncbi:MAG TPA: hypothetical protein VLV86_10625, partial [Vicinamibacterales bacterium]|nr:hypothetical protein [Vicinamibacterales bacterium]